MKQYVGCLFLSFLLFSQTLNSTILKSISDDTLCTRSDLIVTVFVENIEVEVVSNGMPFQLFDLRIQEIHKQVNELDFIEDDLITIRQMGGVASDGTFLEVDGAPMIPLEATLVVFLRVNENGEFYVLGAEQGVFEIIGDTAVNAPSENTMFARENTRKDISSASKEIKSEIVFAPSNVRELPLKELKNIINIKKQKQARRR
jgi:hypothetical protein